jgi:phosphoribosyl 1,2-cyclic phosphodiesterase
MSLYITSLNSGSNGNCYYIGNENEAVLIDAGLSCRETEKRMQRLGLNIKKVKAVFISHEHSDHISGLVTLSKKHKLPVYITAETHKGARIWVEKELINRFTADVVVQIGSLHIMPFLKKHDAAHPHSFTVTHNEVTVGIFTDIGTVSKKFISHFKKCHAAFLESNYDKDMLMNGNYPQVLKKRISDGSGHLSNDEALDLFLNHRPTFMSHLILSHLSANNNKPELVKELFTPHANGTEIIIASRFEETEVYFIQPQTINGKKQKKAVKKSEQQLSLF